MKATIKAYEKVIVLYNNNKFLIRLFFKHPLGREKILQLLHGKSEFYTVSFGNVNGYVKVSNVYEQAERLAENKKTFLVYVHINLCFSTVAVEVTKNNTEPQRENLKMYKCNKNVTYEEVIKQFFSFLL